MLLNPDPSPTRAPRSRTPSTPAARPAPQSPTATGPGAPVGAIRPSRWRWARRRRAREAGSATAVVGTGAFAAADLMRQMR